MNERFKKSVVWGSLVGVGLLLLMVWAWAPYEHFFNQIKYINPINLTVYILSATISYYLRAWRLKLLVGVRGTIVKMYGIVSIHTFLVNLLPFGSGDFSYPYLLKKHQISDTYLDGIPSLAITRIQDFIVTGVLLIISVIWIEGENVSLSIIFWVMGLIIGLSIISGLFFVARKKLSELLLFKYQNIFYINNFKSKLRNILSSLKEITKEVIWETSMLAIAARIASMLGTYYLINGIGVSINLPLTLLICNLYVFLPFLPINSIAGLGVTDAFLVGFFLVAGVRQEIAVPASIQLHVLQFSVAFLLGFIGLAQIHFLKKLA